VVRLTFEKDLLEVCVKVSFDDAYLAEPNNDVADALRGRVRQPNLVRCTTTLLQDHVHPLATFVLAVLQLDRALEPRNLLLGKGPRRRRQHPTPRTSAGTRQHKTICSAV
jgi:hypothetical protein